MTEMLNKEFSRKTFVKGGGALIVGLASGGALASAGTAAMPTSGGYNPDLTQVDSFLTLKSDNTWEIVFGQPEKFQRIEAVHPIGGMVVDDDLRPCRGPRRAEYTCGVGGLIPLGKLRRIPMGEGGEELVLRVLRAVR